jgi:hypothetical protein
MARKLPDRSDRQRCDRGLQGKARRGELPGITADLAAKEIEAEVEFVTDTVGLDADTPIRALGRRVSPRAPRAYTFKFGRAGTKLER